MRAYLKQDDTIFILARNDRKDDEQQLRMDVTENESDVIKQVQMYT